MQIESKLNPSINSYFHPHNVEWLGDIPTPGSFKDGGVSKGSPGLVVCNAKHIVAR